MSFIWAVDEMFTPKSAKSAEATLWRGFVQVSSETRKEHCLRGFFNVMEQLIHITENTLLNFQVAGKV